MLLIQQQQASDWFKCKAVTGPSGCGAPGQGQLSWPSSGERAEANRLAAVLSFGQSTGAEPLEYSSGLEALAQGLWGGWGVIDGSNPLRPHLPRVGMVPFFRGHSSS